MKWLYQCVCFSCLALACDDQTSSNLMPLDPSLAGIPSQGGQILNPTGGVSNTGGRSTPFGGQNVSGGNQEGGQDGNRMATQCDVGETQCIDGNGNGLLVCNENQMWAVEACPMGRMCEDGQCIEPEMPCLEGTRECLSLNEVGLCQNGEVIAETQCSDDQACVRGTCLSLECAQAESQLSYLGCDYLVVDLPNQAFAQSGGSTVDAPLGLVIGNPSVNQSAQVSLFSSENQLASLIGQAQVQSGFQNRTIESVIYDANRQVVDSRMTQANQIEIPPQGSAIFLLPRRMGPLRTSSIRQDAYRVRSSRPIVSYQFSPYCCNFSVSNDASLLYPVGALGVRYRYIGAPYTNENPANLVAPPVIAIVSPFNQTQVNITLPPTAEVSVEQSGRLIGTQGTLSTTLQQDEVLLLSGEYRVGQEDDLSGAMIESTRPIAVFSTHVCTSYPERTAACDHLQEQLLPMSTWGRSYHLTPPVERGQNVLTERIYWKLMSGGGETRIELSQPWSMLNAQGPGFDQVPSCAQSLDGDSTLILNDQTPYCEFSTKKSVRLDSSTPLSILGIMSGQDSVPFVPQAGDPSAFVLAPVRQYRSSYFFMTPDTYANNWISVISPPTQTLLLDGVEVDLSNAQAIEGDEYVIKHISISTSGPHFIEGQAPFGLLVYAYDDYVSYAYTGGLDLVKR
jgi:hypothetical protein